LEKLGAYANERQVSLFEASQEIGLQTRLPQSGLDRLRKFCHWLEITSDRVNGGDTFVEIQRMLDDISYSGWLEENSKTPVSAERKIKNVDELLDWLKRISTIGDEGELSLGETIAKVMLIDLLDRQEEDGAGDRVSLMTFHAAKGLEFPHVFMVGMEENILPHQTSIEEDTIEEERRLAYVGITRAQQTLIFSYCSHRRRYGEMVESVPSRFLNELPEEDLEWSQKRGITEEEKKQRGKESLSALKGLLNQ
jgi:ATP-dependent DNA helicase Rep